MLFNNKNKKTYLKYKEPQPPHPPSDSTFFTLNFNTLPCNYVNFLISQFLNLFFNNYKFEFSLNY
jgi:hypothetical protein